MRSQTYGIDIFPSLKVCIHFLIISANNDFIINDEDLCSEFDGKVSNTYLTRLLRGRYIPLEKTVWVQVLAEEGVEGLIHVKPALWSKVLPSAWCGCWEKQVPAQVSSLSLDRGSKLRDPSPCYS
ncbi:hypothetical protein TNCV_1804321 [Trichonephila clavipes]|nr:hypothetical protein TNCV_1804321 [Trichonephila clavipes]